MACTIRACKKLRFATLCGAESYGRLPTVADEYFAALASSGNEVIGSGMAMEGIEQNPVVYEFASELPFW